MESILYEKDELVAVYSLHSKRIDELIETLSQNKSLARYPFYRSLNAIENILVSQSYLISDDLKTIEKEYNKSLYYPYTVNTFFNQSLTLRSILVAVIRVILGSDATTFETNGTVEDLKFHLDRIQYAFDQYVKERTHDIS